MSLKSIVLSVLLPAVILAGAAVEAKSEEARLLRYPHIMGDKAVFVYAGDIWTVAVEGGRARRVTSFPEGLEVFPRISPDGKWIAFSGEYSGTRQVYVVPYAGGVPKRLTFYPDVGVMPPRGGYDYMVLDWTPDGKKILVRSNRTPFGRRVGRYFLIDPDRPGIEEELQIPEGGPASFSGDGNKLAYNIKSREFRTWKRYNAGRAQDIFIYDLVKNEVERVAPYKGTDNFPMWIDDSIYFTSDRDENRKLNIYRYDKKSDEVSKVTDFKEYDVLWPSRGGKRMIFENGGFLFWLEAGNQDPVKIEVSLGSDRPFIRPVYKNVQDQIAEFSISPSGKRAVFAARGEIFTVPAEHGVTRNITRSDAVRERAVEWSPDGKWIVYLSEKSGEYEVWIAPQDGRGEPKQLTRGTDSWIMGPVWSPDSKRIAYSDKKNRLWVVDVDGGGRKQADISRMRGIGSYSFSPDSKWVVYTKNEENWISSIWAYSIESGTASRLTSDLTNDWGAVFSRDGKYLYFISSRDFLYREREWDDRIYIATLASDIDNPLLPLNDEEEASAGEEKKEKGKDGKDGDGKDDVSVRIDIKGFDSRVLAIPVEAGTYSNLTAVDGGVAFVETDETGKRTLKKFDLAGRETKDIIGGIDGYQIAAGGKKFIYSPSGSMTYGITDFAPGQESSAGTLDLGGMDMRIDPVTEWGQIYHDAWRIMRDWFYDPGMHGVDWKRMHDRYARLLPYVAHRGDLDYLLGELVGELNAGHCYVNEGDMPKVERVQVGLLGCRLEAAGEYYRISKIYSGANWHDNERSPLTEPGTNVAEGTYLLEIDGSRISSSESPYKYLENKVGIPVVLKINDKPSLKGAREITVRPISSELKLFYIDWVERNRKTVDELSGGRIGYIHVPDTYYDGYREFLRAWQPLMNKEALIIDERYNGGGHSPFEMVQMMSNTVYSYWAVRDSEMNSTPFPVNEGPKAMLINGLSSSGGDAFPFYFRKAGLGPLIGETTWGGLIGYGFSPAFIDGGRFAVPGFSFLNPEGQWDVEAVGVDPDIYVWDDPTLIQAGREPMIEKAVEYLLGELKKNPKKKVIQPPAPDRSK
ncbi:MAG: PD40 domain-containing protein [Candidatus Krumholzibacteriota bacterium]|nr:PD40 domain-containing protein [Candidatus Krumholzibacteriota bacterium]